MEFGQLLSDAEANNPGFLLEANPRREPLDEIRRFGLPRGSGAFAVDGPIVADAINRFAAKLGFGLHWIETGRSVPAAGAVMTRWFANHNKMTGTFPDGLMDILGEKQSLSQGTFTVDERFAYSTAISDAKRMAIYFSAFQFSFATISFVTEDLSETREIPDVFIFRPGSIRLRQPLEKRVD